MAAPQYSATEEEKDIMSQIVDRVLPIAEQLGAVYYKELLIADMDLCHTNAYRIDLDRMLQGNIGDVGHDVFGINKYLDRSTGELTHCFVPRFAVEKVTR